MEKNFELSLILGRFNHFHLGHKKIIEISKTLSKKTLVVIGSSQESGTLRNPFKIETRENLIGKLYGDDDSVIIGKLEDMTNEYNISFEWGEYVLNKVKDMTGKRPDLLITGNDESRKGWFNSKEIQDISEMVISRKLIEISGTELRGYLIIGDKEKWTRYMPEDLVDSFDSLRKELLEISVYKEIYDKISDNLTMENFVEVYEKYEEEYKKGKLDNHS